MLLIFCNFEKLNGTEKLKCSENTEYEFVTCIRKGDNPAHCVTQSERHCTVVHVISLLVIFYVGNRGNILCTRKGDN